MNPDPPVRADGRCSQCGKPRYPGRSRKYGGVVAELDPFCSRVCAEAWHGTTGGLSEPGTPLSGGSTRGGGRPNTSLPASTPGSLSPIGYGLCACGCGQPTNLAPENNRSKGYVKGQPMRYCPHHNLHPVIRP